MRVKSALLDDLVLNPFTKMMVDITMQILKQELSLLKSHSDYFY